MPRKQLRGKVAVITGASSGIGHATALELARRGCKLVLAGRSESSLRKVAAEIRRDVTVVHADVSHYEDVERLASHAIETFGRIDVWINNAAVAVWSPVESMSADDMRHVVEVTLLGTMYGSRAAIAHLTKTNGTIINVESGVGERAVPLLSAYCAAKGGARRFSESLRMEMKASGSNVDVVSILPASINTPFYSWGRSRLGVRPHPISVIYPPETVARAIASAAERPQRDVYVGFMAKALSIGQRLSPRFMDAYMLQNDRMFRQQYSDRPDRGESNLYASPGETSIDGAYAQETRKTSVYTKTVETKPAVRWLLAGLTLLVGALLLRRSK